MHRTTRAMKKNIPFTIGVLTILSCLTGTGLAGTHTWSGAGGNASWSNAANWSSGGVPAAGEAAPVKLIFPANAVSRTSTLNISNLKIDAIEINTTNGGYTFPNGGISTTFTGAAGDNIIISGTANDVIWQPALNLQATCRFNLAAGATLDFQGIVTGNGGITKKGAGTLEFTTGASANTFSGPLRIEEGLLNLNKIAGTPCFGGNLDIAAGTVRVVRSHQIPDNSVITMTAGFLTITKEAGAGNTYEAVGAINVSGTASIGVLSPNSFGIGGNITCDNSAAARLTISASSDARIDFAGATRTFAVPHADSSVEISGIINGNGSNAGLTKTGAGRLKLTGENTLNGPFAINGGTFEISAAGSLGGSGSTTIGGGATLVLPNIVLPPTEPISLGGAIITRPGVGAEIQGNIALSGNPSLGSNSSNTLKLSGVLSGNPTQLFITGGSVEFAGSSSNTYMGITSILSVDLNKLVLNKSSGTALASNVRINQKGTLKLLKSHQIDDGVSVAFETGGTFDVNSQIEAVSSIHTIQGAVDPWISLGDGSLTVNGSNEYYLGANVGSQTVTITGSSAASFRKQGTGTMHLAGSQTGGSIVQDLKLYVEAGVLDLQGYWKSPIHVLGGLLKGTAQTANVIAAGGNIAFDKFTSANLTNTGSGGNVIFALNGAVPGSAFPHVTVTGTINLTGLQLQGAMSFIPRNESSFTIIKNNGPGAINGTFVGLPEGSILNIEGRPFRISYQGGPEGKDVVLYFIGEGYGYPEIVSVTKLPSTAVQIEIEGMPGEKVAVLNNSNGLTGNWQSMATYTINASGKATHVRWNGNLQSEFYRLSYTK